MPFPAGLLYFVMMLLIAGVLLWALSAIPGIDPTIKQIVRIIIIAVIAIYAIYFLFGLFAGGPGVIHRPY